MLIKLPDHELNTNTACFAAPSFALYSKKDKTKPIAFQR